MSAQAAVVETSEQQPACSSSQRADAAHMATLPELKVEDLSSGNVAMWAASALCDDEHAGCCSEVSTTAACADMAFWRSISS
eukprot:CAMPEP_0172167534 /NCGR_PEP_ID=MMETSP1050-20130122/9635_1 /TAXON_ID=233186 /ORGANISM="Cryptomonas curvata, Strain CCAP979/52" /LENGTH=81 /DNA_ID=CAMNT_0012838355 /DNA_START=806 /DNA_END=1052 /DNA_ORIENTATION=-